MNSVILFIYKKKIIYRDRTPFVLTSDMAYVINGGDKPSAKFHHFVDLCCQAFNVVRKHGNLILHLFGLVSSYVKIEKQKKNQNQNRLNICRAHSSGERFISWPAVNV